MGAYLGVFIVAGASGLRYGWGIHGFGFPPIWILFVLNLAVLLLRATWMESRRADLLLRRYNSQHKVATTPVFLVYMTFLALLGVDHSYGGAGTELMGLAFWMGGHALSQWALNVNDWAISSSELQAGQKVCSAGPYRYTAHPMYLGTWLICTGAALFLCSFYAFVFAFFIIGVALTFRAEQESKMLIVGLPGYSDYILGRK